jgi:cold shock CspA family protein
MECHPRGSRNGCETPLWLPEHRTLVFADALTERSGALRVWMSPTHAERVIISHGEPVHDRAAFERALTLPQWPASPLDLAAYRGDLDRVRTLVESGATGHARAGTGTWSTTCRLAGRAPRPRTRYRCLTARSTWATEKTLAEGTIKKLVSDRGFGFISQADGTEIFFHRSKVVGSFDTLSEGQKVTYEKAMDPRRNKENAEKVTPA